MIENGNGHVDHGLVMEPAEPDDAKVSLLTTAVTAAMWYQQDRTNKAHRVLVDSVRDCLRQMLGCDSTVEEVNRVLRGEL